MKLQQHIEDVRNGIRAGQYGNEAAVSQGIVLRLLQAVSYTHLDVYKRQHLRGHWAEEFDHCQHRAQVGRKWRAGLHHGGGRIGL